MANNKISVIVEDQLPAFIRADYPLFIAFLKAYYEYMEQEGKLLSVQERQLTDFDVDATPDEFLVNFQKKFLAGFPTTVLADKRLLVKTIKDFYSTKGSEQSLKFLFLALYGENIELSYPNRNILRVSDGKWVIEKSFRVAGNIINTYEGDGLTSVYYLSDSVTDESKLLVKLNDVELNNSLYSVNSRVFTLISPLGVGDVLKIEIEDANFEQFIGKQVFGTTTGASAIVNKYQRIYDKSIYYNELIITDITKNFELGEEAYYNLNDPTYNVSITVSFKITSAVIDINVIYGGKFYNIGDPVLVTSGGGYGATAYVSEITEAGIDSTTTLARGAGFVAPQYFNSTGGGGGSGVLALMNGVDSSGNVHPSTYAVSNDLIRLYQNTLINAASYGFAANASANMNCILANAFSYQTYGPCGPIDPSAIIVVQRGRYYITPPTLYLDSPLMRVNVGANTANIYMTDFGILGAMQIITAGANYAVGDELVFTNVPSTIGQDAAAAVTEVSATGGIAKVYFQAPRITGTVNVGAANQSIVGTGTNFTADLKNGKQIIVNNEIRIVSNVNSATLITVSNAFTYTANNKKLGVYGRNFIGGSGYEQFKLPSVTVQSATGSNANIVVTAIIGDGESVYGSGIEPMGRVKNITITNPGSDYISQPTVDMTTRGDGKATAEAEIAGGYYQYPGYYKSSDGFVSGPVKIQGRHFYQFFSYVIRSKKTLDVYEKILLDVAHPAGLKYFAEYDFDVSTQNLTFLGAVSGNIASQNSVTITTP